MCPETRSDDRADQLSLVDTYKIALETRNLEINLFWQRSNYFLVLNTAIAVGFFSRGDQDKYSFLLGLLGVGAAYLWLLINLGSKFWQSRWEHRLEVIEEKLPIPVGLFSAKWPDVSSDVERSFDTSYPAKRWYGRWPALLYKWAVLRKPSVSRVMTALSLFFAAFWIGVSVTSGLAAF
jgi:hypothetical protein